MPSAINGGLATIAYHAALPQAFRSTHQAVAAQRVERHARNLQAVKQNKVDLRQLLALPVYDPAHPYYLEKPWEVYFKADAPPEATSFKGNMRKWEVMTTRENEMYEQTGLLFDDCYTEWFFAVRQGVRRLPKDQAAWRERRTNVSIQSSGSGGVGIIPTQYWVHPSDDVSYLAPYIKMASDENEEKWGFMAGEENIY
eukprot:TRINITY_DN38109_c0_g1_i1.p1 TRINITY_DN38109_c0_g1~~TRINITY_DN38109_c0_g1_i1.p1  ORF type:complete len:221 (+),score=88.35 TRINITY_DN38109_c0_g1_i1:70-663(+)